MITNLAAVFVSGLLAASLFVPAARAAAIRLGAVDRPSRRRVHMEITPRLGGIAVYAGVLAGLLVALGVGAPEVNSEAEHAYLAIVLTSTAVLILGFVDDIRGLKPLVKLLGEVGLAVLLVGAGLRIEDIQIPFIGTFVLGDAASLVATVLWMVAVTNAFNLIDGVNGLAGGVGGITAATLLVLGFVAQAPVVVIVGAALAGALLAFLRHNVRPGTIFLGDSGSLYVGFLLAALTVHLGQWAARPVFPGAGLLLMGLPLVEVATTIVRRAFRSRALRHGPAGILSFLRRELMRPDLGHLHHCLIRRGLRAEATAGFLVAVSSAYCLASVSFFAIPGAQATAWLAAAATTLLCWVSCRPLSRSRRLDPGRQRSVESESALSPIMGEFPRLTLVSTASAESPVAEEEPGPVTGLETEIQAKNGNDIEGEGDAEGESEVESAAELLAA